MHPTTLMSCPRIHRRNRRRQTRTAIRDDQRQVRCAEDIRTDRRSSWVRRRFVIAHGHTEPQGWAQLKIESSPSSVLGGEFWWVLRQLHQVHHCISRTCNAGVEKNRRLVVTRVCAVVPDRLVDLGAQDAGSIIAGKCVLTKGRAALA